MGANALPQSLVNVRTACRMHLVSMIPRELLRTASDHPYATVDKFVVEKALSIHDHLVKNWASFPTTRSTCLWFSNILIPTQDRASIRNGGDSVRVSRNPRFPHRRVSRHPQALRPQVRVLARLDHDDDAQSKCTSRRPLEITCGVKYKSSPRCRERVAQLAQ